MSDTVTFSTKGMYIGTHAYWCDDGTTIPSQSNVASDSGHIPGSTAVDLSCWQHLGCVESMQIDPKVETVEAKGPSPCILKTVDEAVKSVDTSYTFDCSTVTKLGKELMLLTKFDSNGEGTIGSTPIRKGWLCLMGINSDGTTTMVLNAYGSIKLNSAVTMGNGEFTKPQFLVKQLESTLGNKVKFNE